MKNNMKREWRKIMKNNKKIIIKVILMFILSICLVPTVALADEIGDIDIENVIFNYNPGDKPKASAIKCFAKKISHLMEEKPLVLKS